MSWMSSIRSASISSLNASDQPEGLLHRAGWPVGDVSILTPEGPAWLVSGHNGEDAVSARAATQAETWHRALPAV